MQLYTVYFTFKLLYMFRVVSPPIIRSKNNYLQHLVLVNRCCYLSMTGLTLICLCWVQHRQINLNSSTITTGNNNS